MVILSWKLILVIAIILYCCFSTFANFDETVSTVTTKADESQSFENPISTIQPEIGSSVESKEDEGTGYVRPQNPQMHIQNGIHQKLENLQYISILNEKLELLEKKMTLSFLKLSIDFETLKLESNKRSSELDRSVEERVGQALNILLSRQASVTTTPTATTPTTTTPTTYGKHQTPEEYLSSLSSPMIGSTFNRKTVEQLAAEIPDAWVVAIEIVNYLSIPLSDYQMHLPHGVEHQRALSTIPSQTREVFVLKTGAPHGVVRYRVGDTGFSLHLGFFFSGSKYAVGILPNNLPVNTIWPIINGCEKYNHTGTPDSMKCIQSDYNQNNTTIVSIHHCMIYVKLTIRSVAKNYRQFLKMEVFQFVSGLS